MLGGYTTGLLAYHLDAPLWIGLPLAAVVPGAIGLVLGRIVLRLSGPYLALTTRSEEHTSELQSLMRSSYAVFCLKKKTSQYRERRYRVTKLELDYLLLTSDASTSCTIRDTHNI